MTPPLAFTLHKISTSISILYFLDLLLQLTVSVYDSANPEQKAYANLTITVERNENRPTFQPNEYFSSEYEIISVGTTVATVR